MVYRCQLPCFSVCNVCISPGGQTERGTAACKSSSRRLRCRERRPWTTFSTNPFHNLDVSGYTLTVSSTFEYQLQAARVHWASLEQV